MLAQDLAYYDVRVCLDDQVRNHNDKAISLIEISNLLVLLSGGGIAYSTGSKTRLRHDGST